MLHPAKGLSEIPALALQNKEANAIGVYKKLVSNRQKLNFLARFFVPAPVDDTLDAINSAALKALDLDQSWRYAEWIPGIGTVAGIRGFIRATVTPKDYLTNKCAHVSRSIVALTSTGIVFLALPSCIASGIVDDPS